MKKLNDTIARIFRLRDDDPRITSIARAATIANLPAGSVAFASGDPCENFVFIINGEIRVRLSTRTGRDITLFRLSKGQTCALTTSCLLSKSDYYAEGIAERASELLLVPSEMFRSILCESPEFAENLVYDYASRITALTNTIDRLTSRDIDAELTLLLLNTADAGGIVALSHRRIADEIGTAREVISRKLKDLEKAGLVKLGRRKITLSDSPELRSRLSVAKSDLS